MKNTILLISFMYVWMSNFAMAVDKHEAESNVISSEVKGHDGHEHDEAEHDEAEHDEVEHDGHEHGETEHDDHQDKTASLHFSESRLRDFGIEIKTVSSGLVSQQITLPGEVQLNKERVAHINPRFSAKVINVLARTGDVVNAGQVLAVAESSNTLAQFELTSLIAGTITNSHITLGEVLDASDTAFVVADLSQLWVEIDLYPKHVSQVIAGQTVIISTQHGSAPATSKISYVAPLVEEQTRTGLARVLLDNKHGQWKPGIFITATITLNETPVDLVLPLTAVIEVDGASIVFVQKDEEWEPRKITLGRRDSKQVEVLSGLKLGERYVSKGGFTLKAQLQKGAFDDGHNH